MLTEAESLMDQAAGTRQRSPEPEPSATDTGLALPPRDSRGA